jgi:hypothetical protein
MELTPAPSSATGKLRRAFTTAFSLGSISVRRETHTQCSDLSETRSIASSITLRFPRLGSHRSQEESPAAHQLRHEKFATTFAHHKCMASRHGDLKIPCNNARGFRSLGIWNRDLSTRWRSLKTKL